MKHGVILGDPAHFRIKNGKNPWTRDAWGLRKKVDLAKAVGQWNHFKGTLEGLGAQVFVLEAKREFPGMVFPANAGFLYPKYELQPLAEKRFYLSRLLPSRAGETRTYTRFLNSLGLRLEELPYLFEGEADFFECGDFYIFTYGDIVPTGFRVRAGRPPWEYRFSHRSDARNAEALRRIVSPRTVLTVKLTDTRFYHGDTALFAFGPRRENLLAYLEALEPDSAARLKKVLGDRLVPISRKDAENFVANAFQMDTPEGPHILFPEGVSEEVKRAVSKLNIPFTTVDVSEFFTKGGGSIKCMLCDLGPVA